MTKSLSAIDDPLYECFVSQSQLTDHEHNNEKRSALSRSNDSNSSAMNSTGIMTNEKIMALFNLPVMPSTNIRSSPLQSPTRTYRTMNK
jgi:hypothetical protein